MGPAFALWPRGSAKPSAISALLAGARIGVLRLLTAFRLVCVDQLASWASRDSEFNLGQSGRLDQPEPEYVHPDNEANANLHTCTSSAQ